MKRWQQHAALLSPALIYFAPVLFFGRVLYFRDTGLYFYPHKAMIAAALHSGHLPQWNPNEYGGLPLLADPNFNVFHPLSLITWLLPMPWSFGLFTFAASLVAAYGARKLALLLGLDEVAAVVAGLIFTWCGPYLSLMQGGQLVGPAFLPWVCAAAVRLAREPSRKPAAWATAAAALMLLSGTPEIGACAFGLGLLFALQGGLKPAAIYLASCALGAGIAMVQLLPTAEFVRESSRGGHGFSWVDATHGSFWLRRLPELIVPFFSGAPDSGVWLYPDDERNWLEQAYFGAIPLLLALHGLPQSKRWRGAWIACLAFVLIAFGRHTPLYALLWKLLPPLHNVRFPEKLIVPLAIPIALSAGAGWTRLRALELPRASRLLAGAAVSLLIALGSWLILQRLELPEWREAALQASAQWTAPMEFVLAALALLLVAGWSRKLLSPQLALLLCALLLLADLGVPAARFDPTIPVDELVSPSPLLEAMAKDSNGAEPWSYRVDVHSSGVTAEDARAVGEPGWTLTRSLFRLRRLALFDANPAAQGLQLALGYSGFPSGRMRAVADKNGKRAADLLGIRYAVEFGKPAPSIYAKLGFHPIGTVAGGWIRLLRNDEAQPRLTLWPSAVEGEGLSSCGAPTLKGAAAVCPLQAFGSAKIVRYENEWVEADVDAPAAAVLRLADTSSDGWSVFVDGASAESLMVDGGLRAVRVPAGRHLVSWKYRAPGLAKGAIVSAISLLVLAVLALAAGSSRDARAPLEVGHRER